VQLGATDSETAFIYAAGAVGMTTFGLLAGRIRSRYGFTKVAKWALIIESVLFVVLGFMTNPWLAMVVFACMQGLSILFNVQTASLRQLITPNHMLGRVMTIAASWRGRRSQWARTSGSRSRRRVIPASSMRRWEAFRF
jgi:MFS family permease